MDAVRLLQVGAAFMLNLGFAWLVGSWFARFWMAANGKRRRTCAPGLRLADLYAAGAGAIGATLSLLVAAAVMGDVGLREACPMFWTVVTGTDFGHAGSTLAVIWIVLFLLNWSGHDSRATDVISGLLLTALTVVRASMGHAGENGLFSLPLLAESVHFAAIGLWSGAVLVTAWFTLSERRIGAGHVKDAARYLDLMSHHALIAVILIVGTGIFSAWHRLGGAAYLLHTSYGITLVSKVALVAIAVAIGGFNKFIGLPAASRSLQGLRMVRMALRIESVLLVGALLAASILTSSQPPAVM